MRLWATIRDGQRILRQVTIEADYTKLDQVEDWAALLGEACHTLDLARPVLLKKHLKDLAAFSRAVFKPEDFMEPVDFQRFEVEAIFDKKKTPQTQK